jgi:hypothetical protein
MSFIDDAYLPSGVKDAADLYGFVNKFPNVEALPSFFGNSFFQAGSSFRPRVLSEHKVENFPLSTYPSSLCKWLGPVPDLTTYGITFANAADAYFSVRALQQAMTRFYNKRATLTRTTAGELIVNDFDDALFQLVKFFYPNFHFL